MTTAKERQTEYLAKQAKKKQQQQQAKEIEAKYPANYFPKMNTQTLAAMGAQFTAQYKDNPKKKKQLPQPIEG